MNNLEKYDQEIDDVLFGSDNNSKEILQSSELQDELKSELNFRKNLVEDFESKEVQELRARLTVIQDEYLNEEQTQVEDKDESIGSNNWTKILGIIFGLVILSSIAYYVLQSTGEETNQNYYASYYEPLKMEVSERGEEDNLSSIQELYNTKNYKPAISKLDELIKEDDNSVWRIYRGISLLEIDKPEAALSDFEKVNQSKSVLWNDQAIWYTAMAYLKIGNTAAAKTALQKLTSSSDSDHYKDAIELLKEI
jgi:hypothetical protein